MIFSTSKKELKYYKRMNFFLLYLQFIPLYKLNLLKMSLK